MTRLLSVRSAAERIGCGTDKIRDMIASGALTRYDLGPRMTRVSEAELEAFVEQCRVNGGLRNSEEDSQLSEGVETANNVVRLERLIGSELSKL